MGVERRRRVDWNGAVAEEAVSLSEATQEPWDRGYSEPLLGCASSCSSVCEQNEPHDSHSASINDGDVYGSDDPLPTRRLF